MERNVDSTREQLESDLRAYEGFLNQPICRDLFDTIRARAEESLNVILNQVPSDLFALSRREQAIGRVQGLQFAETYLRDALADLKNAVNEH